MGLTTSGHASRFTHHLLVSRCRLILHLPRGVLHCFDDVLIAGAATQITFQAMSYLLSTWIRIAIQDLRGSHNHPRRAVAALQAVMFPEALLDRVQIAAHRHAFNGGDVCAVSLDGKHRTGLNRLSVENNRARAADRSLAADVRAGQPQHISDVMYQQQARLNFVSMSDTVDGDADSFFH